MMKNIKSEYFIKILFLFVDEKQKLKIVKYNKWLQKILNLSNINYAYFSGIYIIYESKRKIKEYDYDGELRLEGEYLNWKRNGKGKEYDYCDNLEFKAEYLNGKKWKRKIILL